MAEMKHRLYGLRKNSEEKAKTCQGTTLQAAEKRLRLAVL